VSKKKKELQGKLYLITIGDGEGAKQLLVRAKTKQGAITYAANRMLKCEYADQNTLYEATKAGVEIVDIDADPRQPRLPGVDPKPKEEESELPLEEEEA
jgi:hypothetical protein